ncbi:MAG: transglutaminase family protein [Methanomassiliicoccales archaeon]|nr:transglutaminase family protein [Methanomassiliicoccales archaeon]
MSKRVIAILAIIVVIISIIAFTGLLSMTLQVGFAAGDLVEPDPTTITRSSGSAPSPSTNQPQMAHWGVTWEIPQDGVYSEFGGILWLTLNNFDPKDIWVYGISLSWVGVDNATYSKDTGVLAGASENTLVGILPFGAPLEPGIHQYRISARIAVQSATGYWYDWGSVLAADNNYYDVQPTPPSTGWNTDTNPINYYDKVNAQVDEGAVGSVITQIHQAYPGAYSVLQICEGYEWVRSHVAYASDEGDYWQSARETMTLMTGDCEDHAILMASIIKGLGGNARVNVISGHAFPTVFVAENESGLAKVEESVSSYYWTENGSLRINYLVDDFGYWMVIDTTGEPYVGGLPALCRYASPGSWPGTWTFSDSDFLITLDATGRTSTEFNLF